MKELDRCLQLLRMNVTQEKLIEHFGMVIFQKAMKEFEDNKKPKEQEISNEN